MADVARCANCGQVIELKHESFGAIWQHRSTRSALCFPNSLAGDDTYAEPAPVVESRPTAVDG